jgi:hypothetical protein
MRNRGNPGCDDGVLDQIAEDTCEAHGIFVCEVCFSDEVYDRAEELALLDGQMWDNLPRWAKDRYLAAARN